MSEPISICHISDCLPESHDSWGGAEQACLRLVEASARAGIDVSVITTRPARNVRRHNIKLFHVPILESCVKTKIIRSLKQLSIPFDPVSFLSIYKILRKIKPDIIHLHRVNMLSLSSILSARLLDIPVIVSLYDYFYFCPKETVVDNDGKRCLRYHGIGCVKCMGLKRYKFLKKALLGLRKLFFDLLLRNVHYHVLSESSFNIVRSYGIDAASIYRVQQIFSLNPQSVNRPQFKKGMILYTGWLQMRKGFHVLLEAMPGIIKSCPDAFVIAIGAINNDNYFDKIQHFISANGLSRKVALLGKKDSNEVFTYINEANVVVIPEQWENMSPVVLIEAMSWGKAVVASNIGGIPEFVIDGENGFLAEPSSPEAFADKIIKILDDDDLTRMIGDKAAQHIASLMIEEKIMNEYRAMYETMIGDKNG